MAHLPENESTPSLKIVSCLYEEFDNLTDLPHTFILGDHLYGFDQELNNELLVKLNHYARSHDKQYTIVVDQCYARELTVRYDRLTFEHSMEIFLKYGSCNKFVDYYVHPTLNFKNFVCSFNGTPHVGRQLLVSILQKFGFFNPSYCSKNFSYSVDALDGHITDYVQTRDKYYRKFFISDDNEDFAQTINSFGHVQYQHDKNIYNLENRLTESFLHVVSETVATSYYPYVTEKFLYSVVTRGLFLAYAQPGWHDHVEKYYGFKRYTKLFDYRFDTIQNPVERLVELVTMISKFGILSADDWRDLYLLEQDTIEYNYNHYFSQDYLKCLAKSAQTVYTTNIIKGQ